MNYGTASSPQAEGALPGASLEDEDDEEKGLADEDARDLRLERLAPYVAEFVGTFTVTFAYGCCQISGRPVFNPFAIASIYTAVIYCFGPVSGGHFNPAITLAAALSAKIPWPKAHRYCAAQATGGLLAGLCCAWIFAIPFVIGPTDVWEDALDVANDTLGRVGNATQTDSFKFSKGIKPEFTLLDMAVIEFAFTWMVVFVHANCVMSKRSNDREDPNHFFGLAVGFVMVAAGYSGQKISGAFCNPAVVLGMNLTSFTGTGYTGVVFMAVQLVAACGAYLIFPHIRPEDFDEDINFIGGFLPPIQVRVICEFLGTFMVVFTVGLNIVCRSEETALAGMAAIMCLVYSLEDVSGGHLNPAVSFAVVCSRRGKLSIDEFVQYFIAQIGAGVCAGLLVGHYKYRGSFTEFTFVVHQTEGYSWTDCAVSEAVMTGLVAFTLLACATATMPPSTTKTNFYFGISIGAAVVSGAFTIGSISGAVLNPALSIGISAAYVYSPGNGKMLAPPPGFAFLGEDYPPLLKGQDPISDSKDLWPLANSVLFSAFQLGGGLLAAALFFVTHQKEYMKQVGFPVSSVSSGGLD